MDTMEKIQLLERIRTYMAPASNTSTYSVYMSPAQSLRSQADAIEARERDLVLFDKFISELKHTEPNLG